MVQNDQLWVALRGLRDADADVWDNLQIIAQDPPSNTAANTTSYIDTTADGATTDYYVVRAVLPGNDSASSPQRTAVTPSPTVTSEPLVISDAAPLSFTRSVHSGSNFKPATHQVEIKTRASAFALGNHSFVTVKNICVFATGTGMKSTTGRAITTTRKKAMAACVSLFPNSRLAE